MGTWEDDTFHKYTLQVLRQMVQALKYDYATLDMRWDTPWRATLNVTSLG